MLKSNTDNRINFSPDGSASCNGKIVSSKSKFFMPDEYIIVKFKDDKMLITKPTIDYGGKCLKVCKMKNTEWMQFKVSEYDLPVGTFEFDADESNEDMAVIYLK